MSKKTSTKKPKISNDELVLNNTKIIGRIIYEKPNRSLIDEYFDLQIEFEKKYGKKTLVMMQVGGFFESYGVSNKEEEIGNLREIADLLNIQLSRRNKSIIENSRSNALMMGFPLHVLNKYVNVLINNCYTLVIIEQTSEPPNVVREITAVYSTGTYIEGIQNSDPNNIGSIYIEENVCYRTGSSIYLLGLSTIDLTTGECTVYQKNNHLYDKKAVFEDMYRFIESYNPKEIIFHHGELKTIRKEDVLNALNTQNRIIHFEHPIISNEKLKLKYQNEILKKGYKDCGILEPIEYVNMERSPQALISFVSLFEFAYEHNEKILEKIKKPTIWEYGQHLILYHNTAYQLNIIPSPNHFDNSSKYKSLYDVLQKTSTPMGRRLLKYRIMNPMTNIDELERRYEQIEKIQSLGIYSEIEKHLNEINDMERMHRKMEIGTLHPYEFGQLCVMYDKVNELVEYLNTIEDFGWEELQIDENIFERLKEYKNEYNKIFDIEEIKKHGLTSILGSFFNKGVDENIDKNQNDIYKINQYFNDLCKRYSNLIEMGQDEAVKLENNERDGYFLTTTKKRVDVLLKKLNEEEKNKLIVKTGQSSTVKITSDDIDMKSKILVALKEKIKVIVKDKYLEYVKIFITNYDSLLAQITQFIAEIDLIKSSVKVANLYNYHRPRIINKYNNKSYFSAKKLRHPLIEILHDDVKYIDNNIELLKGDDECNGILLMGLNGVGKSSMAKAIGTNIIMAQAGFFVAGDSFEYYPYNKIFTRINGDDNIFKGMSSFVVEMSELRSILKYADENSLVLGDEVCKGTEESSALAIVSASIQTFSEREVNFIMATHFHKLHQMDEIQQLNNVRFKHLSVDVDELNDKIIYGRKLLDGPGDTLYGIEIARFIINDSNFIQKARLTRDKILQQSSSLSDMVEHRSKYNSDLIMDNCMVCKKNRYQVELHTHHLTEQHEYDGKKENIDGIRKNQLANLVVLCEQHHMETHQTKIIIEGWKDTTHGRELFWYYNADYAKPKSDEKYNLILDNENKKEDDEQDDNKSVDSFESFKSKNSQISNLTEGTNNSNKTEDEMEDDDILVKEKEKRDKKQDDEKTWLKNQFIDLKRHFYDLKKLTTQLKKRMKDYNIKMTPKKLNFMIEQFEKEYQKENQLNQSNLS